MNECIKDEPERKKIKGIKLEYLYFDQAYKKLY